ncbi:chemotaxis protein methyltransferase CheR [Amycolatopsis mediterranei S699]|uniref:protein-glutamate O-methyltransferase n=2 Tax=Amycolatopsis mediterranei TaxID=33910 RepID=A0A0H3D4N1_AMYMU|nr:CheR family methyltransferase [Amycolatopsis mediterranei]ADJ45910.1 chemotaxis protein methyltransferase CheR [Amycolatopsis mediterranei U32]AEK42691.1 chemotaxis protein methyltransferase CheR [Amycolatopsis mediterranei S699]AFO77621.1 chemotaxis protein methyltransferase CheR [Amycolatopsis mediterranei S699]AGT84749.1 chemotaxis protein methyltransferase CheR [Amycolatopsis mediterranei RB]KDO05444.1 chemotaxis protein CheR [Amycolatopsis mediterranei]
MTEPKEPNGEFESVLAYLKESRGFDFTGYKRSSLMRRVRRRMSQVEIDSYADYIDQLQVNADEFVALFNTILINVTGFFRDPDAWDYLRDEVLPALLAERTPEEPIRVWSAGCAAGQEAYSLAMLLAEALGVEAFRQRVKIYATDVDDEALAQARHAAYSPAEVEGLTEAQLEQYFELVGSRYCFRKDLRRSIIFGRNDLVQDAPISRIDLLVCRNTLMYFNAETQTKILERFHFALAPRGVLFLGKAEMLLSHARIFEPLDLKRRVFRKAVNGPVSFAHLVSHGFPQRRTQDISGLEELREHAFSASPVAQIVVTEGETTALINAPAEVAFGLSERDIGRPLRDLDVSYRPVALRAYVEQARLERRSLRIKDVEWRRAGETVWYEVHVNPLVNKDKTLLGVSVVFHDVSWARQLLTELEHTNRQLESAYEELQSTNEELETTNEELQSTVEELETTNEELQSTNEELETMNEELQSTNDELQTINDALRERSLDLDEVNEFLESVLTSIHAGIIVIDSEMRIKAWNRGAEDLWGVRREEAEGTHLLNLDIGLPVADLRPVVREALADPGYYAEQTFEAVNRRGRTTVVRLLCGALRSSNGESHGALLMMEETKAGRPE